MVWEEEMEWDSETWRRSKADASVEGSVGFSAVAAVAAADEDDDDNGGCDGCWRGDEDEADASEVND
jgi:hypothetical protein